ncbi:MAG: L,D-transpeptidase family protein [Actinomycetota bacterium]
MAHGKHSMSWGGRGWWMGLAAALVLVVLGGGTAFAAYRYERSSASHILLGVTIDGVDVGGMTRDQAIRAVTARADTSLGGDLSVGAAGYSWNVTPAALGTRADIEGAVDRAFAAADSLPLLSRVYHHVTGRPVETAVELGFTYDQAKVEAFVQQAYAEVAKPAVNAEIKLVEGELVVQKPRTGEELRTSAAAARILNALSNRVNAVQVPVRTVEPEVTVDSLGKTIVLDLSENMLYLYDGFKVVKEYPVATAASGYSTPVGTWEVVNKAENPGWYNPAPDGWGAGLPLYIPPGSGNPLGTRALYLDAPGIRIHGTYNSGSIGTYASHGCVRMFISDSEELYPLVPMGTTVLIKP